MLPHVGQPIADARGSITRPWHEALSRLADAQQSGDSEAVAAELRALATLLGSPDGTVAGIPPQQAAKLPAIFGGQSIAVFSNGERVELSLSNDALNPGNRAVYGTDSEGERGFFPIADAIADDGSILRDVGVDGVTTLGLADLEDAGGGTLRRFTRDAKGRVSGTSDATTDNLPEGSNLYFTDERAAAAAPVQSVNGQTGHVVVGGAGGSGGILPMVNGEVPPVLMHFDDGSLLYAQVE